VLGLNLASLTGIFLLELNKVLRGLFQIAGGFVCVTKGCINNMKFCKLRQKVISAALCVMMFITQIYTQPAHAALPENVLPNVSALPVLDPFKLKIPAALGKVEEAFSDHAGQTVILIQDAHAIEDAQKNIQKLTAFFQEEYGVNQVAVEGASGTLEPQIFKSFPDSQKLKSVFKEYLQRGELTGASAAAIFNSRSAHYEGVENWSLYEKGYRAYLTAAAKRPEITARLAEWSKSLTDRKAQVYSPELLALDQVLNRFFKDHGDLTQTLQSLAKVLPPEPESELALMLSESRRKGDNAAVIAEVRWIAGKIRFASQKENVAAEKLKEFERKFQDFQTDQVSAQSYALYLKDYLSAQPELISQLTELDPKMIAKLTEFSSAARRLEAIEGTRFFKDFLNYAKSVKASLMTSDAQRALDRESESLALFERFNDLKLDQEDWENIQKGKGGWAKGEGKVGGEVSQTALSLPPSTFDLRPLFKDHFAFYENAKIRDGVMFEKVLKLLERRGEVEGEKSGGRWKVEDLKIKTSDERQETGDAIILIAGGFHTHGITKLLKEKGISYVVIMPAIANVPEKTNYEDQMLGHVSWSEYLKVENGAIDLNAAFIRGTRDRLLGMSRLSPIASRSQGNTGDESLAARDPALLKNWRDQIIRDLADQGKIEQAGDSTRYIDEIVSFENQDPFKRQWIQNIKRFMGGMRDLDQRGELNPASVAKLLALPSVLNAPVTANALGHSELHGFELAEERILSGRSEVRMINTIRALFASKQKQAERSSEPDALTRRDWLRTTTVGATAVMLGLSNVWQQVLAQEEGVSQKEQLRKDMQEADVIIKKLMDADLQDEGRREFSKAAPSVIVLVRSGLKGILWNVMILDEVTSPQARQSMIADMQKAERTLKDLDLRYAALTRQSYDQALRGEASADYVFFAAAADIAETARLMKEKAQKTSLNVLPPVELEILAAQASALTQAAMTYLKRIKNTQLSQGDWVFDAPVGIAQAFHRIALAAPKQIGPLAINQLSQMLASPKLGHKAYVFAAMALKTLALSGNSQAESALIGATRPQSPSRDYAKNALAATPREFVITQAPAVTQAIFIDDVPELLRITEVSVVEGYVSKQAEVKKDRPSERDEGIIRYLSQGLKEPPHILLYGGRLAACLVDQIQFIVNHQAKDNGPQKVFVTHPLPAIFKVEVPELDQYKFDYARDLSVSSVESSDGTAALQNFIDANPALAGDFAPKVNIPKNIRVEIVENGQLLRIINPQGKKTLVLNYLTDMKSVEAFLRRDKAKRSEVRNQFLSEPLRNDENVGLAATPDFSKMTRVGTGGYGTVFIDPSDTQGLAANEEYFYKLAEGFDKRFSQDLLNHNILQEAQTLRLLQETPGLQSKLVELGAAAGLPQVMATGFLPDGRMWLKMKGRKNVRPLNSEFFSSLSRLEKIDTLLRISKILKAVHEAGIIHNDFTEYNILIDPLGNPMIVDWATAVNTNTFSPTVTTATYSALDTTKTEASDIFSFGKTLTLRLISAYKYNTPTDAERTWITPAQLKASGLRSLISRMTREAPERNPILGFILGVLKFFLARFFPSLNRLGSHAPLTNMSEVIERLQAARDYLAAQEIQSDAAIRTASRSEVRQGGLQQPVPRPAAQRIDASANLEITPRVLELAQQILKRVRSEEPISISTNDLGVIDYVRGEDGVFTADQSPDLKGYKDRPTRKIWQQALRQMQEDETYQVGDVGQATIKGTFGAGVHDMQGLNDYVRYVSLAQHFADEAKAKGYAQAEIKQAAALVQQSLSDENRLMTAILSRLVGDEFQEAALKTLRGLKQSALFLIKPEDELKYKSVRQTEYETFIIAREALIQALATSRVLGDQELLQHYFGQELSSVMNQLKIAELSAQKTDDGSQDLTRRSEVRTAGGTRVNENQRFRALKKLLEAEGYQLEVDPGKDASGEGSERKGMQGIFYKFSKVEDGKKKLFGLKFVADDELMMRTILRMQTGNELKVNAILFEFSEERAKKFRGKIPRNLRVFHFEAGTDEDEILYKGPSSDGNADALLMDFIPGEPFAPWLRQQPGKRRDAYRNQFERQFLAILKDLVSAGLMPSDNRPDNFLMTHRNRKIQIRFVDRAAFLPVIKDGKKANADGSIPKDRRQTIRVISEGILKENIGRKPSKKFYQELNAFLDQLRFPVRSEVRSESIDDLSVSGGTAQELLSFNLKTLITAKGFSQDFDVSESGAGRQVDNEKKLEEFFSQGDLNLSEGERMILFLLANAFINDDNPRDAAIRSIKFTPDKKNFANSLLEIRMVETYGQRYEAGLYSDIPLTGDGEHPYELSIGALEQRYQIFQLLDGMLELKPGSVLIQAAGKDDRSVRWKLAYLGVVQALHPKRITVFAHMGSKPYLGVLAGDPRSNVVISRVTSDDLLLSAAEIALIDKVAVIRGLGESVQNAVTLLLRYSNYFRDRFGEKSASFEEEEYGFMSANAIRGVLYADAVRDIELRILNSRLGEGGLTAEQILTMDQGLSEAWQEAITYVNQVRGFLNAPERAESLRDFTSSTQDEHGSLSEEWGIVEDFLTQNTAVMEIPLDVVSSSKPSEVTVEAEDADSSVLNKLSLKALGLTFAAAIFRVLNRLFKALKNRAWKILMTNFVVMEVINRVEGIKLDHLLTAAHKFFQAALIGTALFWGQSLRANEPRSPTPIDPQEAPIVSLVELQKTRPELFGPSTASSTVSSAMTASTVTVGVSGSGTMSLRDRIDSIETLSRLRNGFADHLVKGAVPKGEEKELRVFDSYARPLLPFPADGGGLPSAVFNATTGTYNGLAGLKQFVLAETQNELKRNPSAESQGILFTLLLEGTPDFIVPTASEHGFFVMYLVVSPSDAAQVLRDGATATAVGFDTYLAHSPDADKAYKIKANNDTEENNDTERILSLVRHAASASWLSQGHYFLERYFGQLTALLIMGIFYVPGRIFLRRVVEPSMQEQAATETGMAGEKRSAARRSILNRMVTARSEVRSQSSSAHATQAAFENQESAVSRSPRDLHLAWLGQSNARSEMRRAKKERPAGVTDEVWQSITVPPLRADGTNPFAVALKGGRVDLTKAEKIYLVGRFLEKFKQALRAKDQTGEAAAGRFKMLQELSNGLLLPEVGDPQKTIKAYLKAMDGFYSKDNPAFLEFFEAVTGEELRLSSRDQFKSGDEYLKTLGAVIEPIQDVVRSAVESWLKGEISGVVVVDPDARRIGKTTRTVTVNVIRDLDAQRFKVLFYALLASGATWLIGNYSYMIMALFKAQLTALLAWSFHGVAAAGFIAFLAFIANYYLGGWIKNILSKIGNMLNLFSRRQKQTHLHEFRLFITEELYPVYNSEGQFVRDWASDLKAYHLEMKAIRDELKAAAGESEASEIDTQLRMVEKLVLDAFGSAPWYPLAGKNGRRMINRIAEIHRNLLDDAKTLASDGKTLVIRNPRLTALAMFYSAVSELANSENVEAGFMKRWLPPLALMNARTASMFQQFQRIYSQIDPLLNIHQFIREQAKIKAAPKNILMTDKVLKGVQADLSLEDFLNADRRFFDNFSDFIQNKMKPAGDDAYANHGSKDTVRRALSGSLYSAIRRHAWYQKLDNSVKGKEGGWVRLLRKFLRVRLERLAKKIEGINQRLDADPGFLAKEADEQLAVLHGALSINGDRVADLIEKAREGGATVSHAYITRTLHRQIQWKLFLDRLSRERSDAELAAMGLTKAELNRLLLKVHRGAYQLVRSYVQLGIDQVSRGLPEAEKRGLELAAQNVIRLFKSTLLPEGSSEPIIGRDSKTYGKEYAAVGLFLMNPALIGAFIKDYQAKIKNHNVSRSSEFKISGREQPVDYDQLIRNKIGELLNTEEHQKSQEDASRTRIQTLVSGAKSALEKLNAIPDSVLSMPEVNDVELLRSQTAVALQTLKFKGLKITARQLRDSLLPLQAHLSTSQISPAAPLEKARGANKKIENKFAALQRKIIGILEAVEDEISKQTKNGAPAARSEIRAAKDYFNNERRTEVKTLVLSIDPKGESASRAALKIDPFLPLLMNPTETFPKL